MTYMMPIQGITTQITDHKNLCFFISPINPMIIQNQLGLQNQLAFNFSEITYYNPIMSIKKQEKSQQIPQRVLQDGFQKNKTKIRCKNLEKEISSAKKNSESNIINQFFSFFNSRQKSQQIVRKAISFLGKQSFNLEKIISLFYRLIRSINSKRGRKYINRMILLNFFTPDSMVQFFPQINKSIQEFGYVSIQEMCQLFRRCCQKYLRTTCILSLLTSKRISTASKDEHFKKRRKILKTVGGSS